MSDGAKKATIEVTQGVAVEIELKTPGKVTVQFRGKRGKLVCTAPGDSEIHRQLLDIPNLDDVES